MLRTAVSRQVTRQRRHHAHNSRLYAQTSESIVPDSPVLKTEDVELIRSFIVSRSNLTVITGAGMSTESGLPDYRSPNGSYSKGHKPTTFQEFMRKDGIRRRYWARSMYGWNRFNGKKPNAGHEALANLQKLGHINNIITQNVDKLHHKAGAERIIELHGHLSSVVCMKCGRSMDRGAYQKDLMERNKSWIERNNCLVDIQQGRADGDVALSDDTDFSDFSYAHCQCEMKAIIKPNVVFFGENIPFERKEKAKDIVLDSDGVLVLGTSLMVYSAYSLVLKATEAGIPVVICNIGESRADKLEGITRVQGRTGEIMPHVVSSL